jgi:hypothetical protein
MPAVEWIQGDRWRRIALLSAPPPLGRPAVPERYQVLVLLVLLMLATFVFFFARPTAP